MSISAIRLRALAALTITATALAACGDPAGPDHAEPDIATVTILHGGSTVQLGPGGQTGTLTLQNGQANAITVRVLNPAGTDDPVVVADAEDYEVRIRQGTTSRFTATGTGYPFTGTITTGATTGTAVYTVEVFSLDHGHVEFTALLTATVVASGTT